MKPAESKALQRQRIMTAMACEGPIATSEARERLGIMHPAGRVAELRRMGYAIKTVWRYVADAEGVLHRQGVYLLEAACHEN